MKCKQIVYLALVVFLFSCRKETTYWNTKWTMPVISDQLSLQDLVTDSLAIHNDTSGCKIVLEKTLYRIQLSDLIKIPDTVMRSELAINFPSLSINPGTILSQKNVENQIEIGDAELKKIIVKKGEITISFFNPLSTKTYYTIEIPSFTKDGIPVKKTLVAEKGSLASPSIVRSTLDLSGYTIDLRGVTNGTFNTIVTNFDMQLDPNATTSTKVTNKDITKMEIQIQGIQIAYAQGYFGNLKIQSNNTLEVASMHKLIAGSLALNNAQVTLTIENSCKLMAKGKISDLSTTRTITGNTLHFENSQLNKPFFIAPATTTSNQLKASTKTFLFNDNNSNIVPFIENLGDRYAIAYDFELNPYGNLNGGWDEFFPASELALQLKAEIPLKIHTKDLTFQDTFAFDLSSFEGAKRIASGKFKLQSESSFPIDAVVTLVLLNKNKENIETIQSSSKIAGKASNASENQLSTNYFTPSPLFFSNISAVRYILVKTTFNSVEKSDKIPYNGKINFQLSTDFETNMNY